MPRDDAPPRVVGFKHTAEYFESRARRARNEADHEHHMSAARFYRELAAITPGLPVGFRPPKDVNRAHRGRNRAQMCRAIADLLPDAESKRRLFNLAATYDDPVARDEQQDREVVSQRLHRPHNEGRPTRRAADRMS